jgi:hypothetical protein
MRYTISSNIIKQAEEIKDALPPMPGDGLVFFNDPVKSVEKTCFIYMLELIGNMKLCNRIGSDETQFNVLIEHMACKLAKTLKVTSTSKEKPQAAINFLYELIKLFTALVFENFTQQELAGYIQARYMEGDKYERAIGNVLLKEAGQRGLELGLEQGPMPALPVFYTAQPSVQSSSSSGAEVSPVPEEIPPAPKHSRDPGEEPPAKRRSPDAPEKAIESLPLPRP